MKNAHGLMVAGCLCVSGLCAGQASAQQSCDPLTILEEKVPFTGGDDAYDLAAGDLNGDGNTDLAGVLEQGGAFVVFGMGDGTFGAPTIYGTNSTRPYSVALGDLDMDGDTDLVVGTNSAEMEVRLNDGFGVFGPSSIYRICPRVSGRRSRATARPRGAAPRPSRHRRNRRRARALRPKPTCASSSAVTEATSPPSAASSARNACRFIGG